MSALSSLRGRLLLYGGFSSSSSRFWLILCRGIFGKFAGSIELVARTGKGFEAGFGDEDILFDAHSAPAFDIDSRLDSGDYSGLQVKIRSAGTERHAVVNDAAY